MVNKRSLLAIAGAVLMVRAVAPHTLAQDDDPAADGANEVPTEEVATVELTQDQYDDIVGQLADLTARVQVLESALADQGTGTADSDSATKPKAPAATGSTEPRFTVRDPNPDRGRVTWKDRATNEDGYRIYARRVYCGLEDGADPNQALDTDDFAKTRSAFVQVGKVGADATAYRPVHQDVTAKLPAQPKPRYGSGEIYELYVAAFNEAGESKRVPVGSYITTPEFVCP